MTGLDFIKASPDKADIDFTDISIRYDLSQRKLLFKGYATGSHGKYKTEIAFYDVDPEGLTPEQLGNGEIPMPKDLLNHKCKVDCDCMNYTFYWLKGNLEHNCALHTDAQLTHYKKKTDRPEVNPDKEFGGCKHIISFLKSIASSAI